MPIIKNTIDPGRGGTIGGGSGHHESGGGGSHGGGGRSRGGNSINPEVEAQTEEMPTEETEEQTEQIMIERAPKNGALIFV